MAHSHDDRRTLTPRGLARELSRSPVPRMRGLAPTLPAMRPNGLMPRSVTTPRPGLHDLARALADMPGKRLAKALAPVNRVSEALAPVIRTSELLSPVTQLAEVLRLAKALAPVNRVSEALAPVIRTSELLSPVTQLAEVFAPLRIQPRLGPPVPSLFGDQPCDRPQTETRLVRVSGTREDWAEFDDGHTVGLTKC